MFWCLRKLEFRRTSTVRGVGDGEDPNWIKFRPPCFCALTLQFYSRGHTVEDVRIRGRAKFRVERGGGGEVAKRRRYDAGRISRWNVTDQLI